MKDKIEEKRIFPRVTINFPIKIPPSFLAQSMDLSESGLGFVLEKPLLLSKAKAEIEISPYQRIEVDFKVIWSKYLVKERRFRYGVAFIRLKEEDLDILREMFTSSKVRFISQPDNVSFLPLSSGMLDNLRPSALSVDITNVCNLKSLLSDYNLSFNNVL